MNTPSADFSQTATLSATPVPPKPKHNYTLWLAIGAGVSFVILIVFGIAAGISIMLQAAQSRPVPLPPTSTATPAAVVKTPSAFATDSGLLEIKTNLTNLQNQTDSVDLIEPQIAPPNLDLKIRIQPNQ